MKTSERELTGLASAAALGMGYPYGIGEELAKAVVWLAQRDVDGLGALMSSSPRVGESLAAQAWPLVVDGIHVGSDGPGLLDLLLAARSNGSVASSDDVMSLQLRQLDSPLLMVGLCGAVAKAAEVNLSLRVGVGVGVGDSDSRAELLLTGADTGGPIAEVDLELMVDAVEISIRTAQGAGEQMVAPPTRLAVPDRRWVEAERLAAKTYVPASEQSRHHGAGAGLTDND